MTRASTRAVQGPHEAAVSPGSLSAECRYRFQWYQHIYESLPAIRDDAVRVAEDLGVDPAEENHFGLYAGSSAFAGHLPEYVLEAIRRANTGRIVGMRELGDTLRGIVKDVYGDDFDAAVTNTCESGLRVAFETLFSPPTMRRGEAYRARFITPYSDDLGFMMGYGRPFPPRYKNTMIDRSGSAGELGVEGKSLTNLDAVLVKFGGASYPVHGIRQNPVPLLSKVDPDASIQLLKAAADRHASDLVGFAELGYDTPGYGHGEKDGDGIPRMLRLIGELARSMEVPFIVDAASCCPILGLGPDDLGADVMLWSMDKACRAPASGLLIGRDEVMVPIRKGLGLGGIRGGGVSSHSKAAYSFADPGRDALVGLIEVLRLLRDRPEQVRKPVDRFHEILVEELALLEPRWVRENIISTKSYTLGGTELNYEPTWDHGGFGVPIFSDEDLFANLNPIMQATEAMGIHPPTIYRATVFLGPGMGTIRPDGDLDEAAARLASRAMVKSLEIVCRHAGLGPTP